MINENAMSLDDFYQQLEQVKNQFEWFFRGYKIRGKKKNVTCQCCNGDVCPITAVYNIKTKCFLNEMSVNLACKELGINLNNERDYIVTAADTKNEQAKEVRKRILEILGLKETNYKKTNYDTTVYPHLVGTITYV